tara:strand:- start:215 stop:1231 length:1017 start_codon:yes stop_codon:yes gene_type:complete
MAVNKAFHTNNSTAIQSEKNLYSDLVKEAIQIYGHDVYYIDRTTVAIDNVLGEDSLSKFTTQVPIEMYVENAEGGYEGEKELISQFGLENRNELTLVVHKDRFQDLTKQIRIESGTDTTGGSILLESGTIDQSEDSSVLETVTSGSDFYILTESDAANTDRPLEGDLVYHPILGKIFEVSFVDHDEPFHQLDNNPVFKLNCKQFEYSSEALDTGITDIDSIEDSLSRNTHDYQFTLEQSTAQNEEINIQHARSNFGLLLEETDGDNIIGEDDTTSVGESILLENSADSGDPSYLITEDYIVGDAVSDKTAQNELFDSLDDDVLDFSETNPFGDAGVFA